MASALFDVVLTICPSSDRLFSASWRTSLAPSRITIFNIVVTVCSGGGRRDCEASLLVGKCLFGTRLVYKKRMSSRFYLLARFAIRVQINRRYCSHCERLLARCLSIILVESRCLNVDITLVVQVGCNFVVCSITFEPLPLALQRLGACFYRIFGLLPRSFFVRRPRGSIRKRIHFFGVVQLPIHLLASHLSQWLLQNKQRRPNSSTFNRWNKSSRKRFSRTSTCRSRLVVAITRTSIGRG